MTTFRKTQPETVTPEAHSPVAAIHLRRAEWADAESLFQWRNHDAVRRYSLNASLIDWDTHCDWLRQTLSNPMRVLLIGEWYEAPATLPQVTLAGEGATSSVLSATETPLGAMSVAAPPFRVPVGVLRYDLQGDSAVVSVYLVPEQMGHGYGAPLLRTGSCWMRQEYPAIKRLLAEIRTDNLASLNVFEKAGYQKSDYQGAASEKPSPAGAAANVPPAPASDESAGNPPAGNQEIVWYAYE